MRAKEPVQGCGEAMIHTLYYYNLAGSGGNFHVIKALTDKKSIKFPTDLDNSQFCLHLFLLIVLYYFLLNANLLLCQLKSCCAIKTEHYLKLLTAVEQQCSCDVASMQEK